MYTRMERNETKWNEVIKKQGTKPLRLSCCRSLSPCVLLSRKRQVFGAPWAVCTAQKEKTLFLATGPHLPPSKSRPTEIQVRAGQNEQDNTVFGGHSKPVPMSEVKTQKTKAEAKGKWKISNQRRPVELQLEGQSRKPDEALELFCNRWVPSEDIIWLDNTTRPFFQGTAGFYGSLPDYPTFWPPAKPHCKAS